MKLREINAINFLFILCFLTAILATSTVSASVNSINFPYDNGIITYSHNVELDVSSTASSDCVFFYETAGGIIGYNQTVVCNGVTSVIFPSSNGIYNITVMDGAGSSQTNTVIIDKPSGILITLIYTLSFFILLAMLFIFVINLAKFAMLDTTIYNVAISWTVYFGLLIAYQLNLEYGQVPFVLNWLELIMSIGGWLMFFFPLLAFVISIIKKGFDKKQPLSPQEITGRGLMKYG